MANDREDHMIVTIQCAQYCWEFLFNLRPILEELKSKCKELPVICWSDIVKLFPLSKINERKLLRTSKNKTQYDSECLVDAIAGLVRENLVNNFELVVFTDGCLSRKVADTLKMKLKSCCFYNKITKVRVVLCESDNNNLDSVDPYFLNVFNGIPLIFMEPRNFYEASFEKEIYNVQLQSKIQSKSGLDYLDDLGRYFALESGDYCFREENVDAKTTSVTPTPGKVCKKNGGSTKMDRT